MNYLIKKELKDYFKSPIFWVLFIAIIALVQHELLYSYFPEMVPSYYEIPDDFSKGILLFKRLSWDFIISMFHLFMFLIVGFNFYKDQKNKIDDLIFTKQVKSSDYVLAKIISANIICLMIVIFTGVINVVMINITIYQTSFIEVIEYFTWGIGMIIPHILFFNGVFALFSIISGGYMVSLGIFVLSFVPVSLPGTKSFLYRPVVRINSNYTDEVFMSSHMIELIVSRVYFSLIGIILIYIAIKEYEKLRNTGELRLKVKR